MRLFNLAAVALCLAAPAAAETSAIPPASSTDVWKPDWAALRPVWKARLAAVRASGRTPIFDVESSFAETYMNNGAVLKFLDAQGVAVVGLSPDPDAPNETAEQWTRSWQDMMRRVHELRPNMVFPVPPAGDLRRKNSKDPRLDMERALALTEAAGYPMLGEYFFRHYSSDGNIRAGVGHDLSEPIDGELGELLFSFSQRTGKPFQIHYELEDALIPPLEKMLSRYPGAKVIWCHAGRLRRPELSPVTARDEVRVLRRLLDAHPNLNFDLASLSPGKYPANNTPDSPIWDQLTHRMPSDWQRMIMDNPWRFLAAEDLGSDRAASVPAQNRHIAALLEELPPETRRIVAYRAAWRLLFGETLDDAGPAPAP